MGFCSDIKAIGIIQKLKNGGTAKLSISQITGLIINLADAKNNLPDHKFRQICALFDDLRTCNTKFEIDYEGYLQQAVEIIKKFDAIAPYEKYSGGNETEFSFLMSTIRTKQSPSPTTKRIKDDPETPLKAREYINVLKTHENWDDPTDDFNNIIYSTIHEDNVHRKTDILIEALNNMNEIFSEIKSNPQYHIGSANLNAVVHIRLFLDCVLLYDGDWDTINHLYIVSKATGTINESAHKFINLMIEISDLLDRAIVYLFENLNVVTTDYYPSVERKIRKYLIEYIDDNTDWNKIKKYD